MTDDTPAEEPEPSRWTIAQERCALALASGATARVAAEKARTSRLTVSRPVRLGLWQLTGESL